MPATKCAASVEGFHTICPKTDMDQASAIRKALDAIMLTLRQEGYIEKYKNSRGRYVLTEKAKKVLRLFGESTS